ncbi:9599_t:CDS:2 [Funneliformis mosseae]|uniref:9599_t:CDS:1 n=1 Tax=Funneliformis mosseae TaxID=27381 RepID=A0A9N9HFT5_FUNMO|nr:9599_t:CDS:2 [Funneliformis mosseae]
MPQSGTGVSIEAVDPKMLDMLKQTGRPKMVVGWYHSHPGFECWLSSSVKGKVVIDAFRMIDPQMLMLDQEPLPILDILINQLMKKFQSMLTLAESYNKSVQEESTMTPEQLKARHVGKQDSKRHIEESGRRYIQ